MRYLVVFLALVELAGCAHKREVTAVRMHGAACEQLGYVGGSAEWANCTALIEKYRTLKRGQDFEMPTAKDPNVTMTCGLVNRVTTCR